MFVYCCPDRSHHKLRMIYASSKRVMVEACDAAALPLIKKVRFADLTVSEFTADYFQIFPRFACRFFYRFFLQVFCEDFLSTIFSVISLMSIFFSKPCVLIVNF